MNKVKSVNFSDKIFYGIGNTGYGIVSQTVNNFIMFFGTAVLALPGSLMGVVMAISVMWDALTDPLMGAISDKTRSDKFGRRHGFMIIGCIGMIIFNIMLWSTPTDMSVGAKFIWLLGCLILLETSNTLFITPYTALGTELSDDYNERTSIQSFKTVFFLIGLIIPTLLVALLFSDVTGGLNNAENYVGLAFCTSIICVCCCAVSIMGTFKYIPKLKTLYEHEKQDKKQKISVIFKNFISTFKKPNFRSIILGYSISLISAAFLTGVGLHVFKYVFHLRTSQITLLMGCLIFATIISQAFWCWFSKKYDKKKALLTALGISALGILCFTIIFLYKNSIMLNVSFWLLAISLFICGFGTGALYSLPISMYADLIGAEREKSSVSSSATYTSFLTFAYKIANVVALIIIGVSLDLVGFDAFAEVQLMSVQNSLGWILILGVVFSILFSFYFYSKFKFSKKYDVKLMKNVNLVKKS
ncbi:MAG: MFS transporter [Clostridia bacterium]|nr:MFS transporter [Clostridia bacterium]MBQ9786262.1 MFS transporter [Clostridia bacterium]